MALTLSTPPNDNTFLGNPIPIVIETDGFLISEGTVGLYYIEYTAAPTLGGSHLTVEFNGITVDMVSQTTPITYDGMHFRVKTGFETLDDWLAAHAKNLQGNYDLVTNYNIYIDTGTNRVYFQPKAVGDEWNMTFSATPGTSTSGTTTAGTDREENENYRLFAGVHVLGGYIDDQIDLVEFECEYVDDYTFRARLEEILIPFMQHQVPDIGITNIQWANNHSAWFKIRFYEAYGTPIIEKYIFETTEFYSVLMASFDEAAWPTTTFLSNYEAQFKWLTWQTRTKKITKQQPEWLAFLHAQGSDISYYKIKLQIFYSDDTNETQFLYATDLAIYGYNENCMYVLYFDCSWDTLVSPGAASSEVDKYIVSVVDGSDTDSVLSETFTFKLLADTPVNTRYFLFSNSLGWYDTLRTTGDRVTGIDVSGEVLKKYLTADYIKSDGKYAMSKNDAKLKYTQSTGWLSGSNIAEYLALFLIAPVAFEYVNGALVPIVITKRSIKLHADNEKTFAFEFEYSRAYDYIGKGSVS